MIGPLLLLGALYFLNVIGRMVFPMLAGRLSNEYLLSPQGLGALYLLLAFGFGLSLFSSQFVSAKISHHKVISLSILGSGCLLSLFPMVGNRYFLGIFLFSLGGLSGLFLPSAIAYLGSIIPQEKLGRAVASFSSFQTLAMITTPFFGNWIGQTASYRSFFFGLGICLGLLGLVFQRTAKNRDEKGGLPSFDYIRDFLSSKINRWMLALHALAMGLNMGIYSISPAYFILEQGWSDEILYTALSFSRLLGLLSSLLGGWILDVWGLAASLTAFLFLAGSFTLLLGALNPKTAVVDLCIESALAIGLTTLVYAGISKITPKERKASAVSLFASSSFVIGAGLIPQILGIFGTWKVYSLGFAVFGIVSISASLLFFKSAREVFHSDKLNSSMDKKSIL